MELSGEDLNNDGKITIEEVFELEIEADKFSYSLSDIDTSNSLFEMDLESEKISFIDLKFDSSYSLYDGYGDWKPLVSYEIRDLNILDKIRFGYDKHEILQWGWRGSCSNENSELIDCSEVEVGNYALLGDPADPFTTVTQVTTQEANDSSLVAKTPEPSLMLGLIALGGFVLGSRKKKI